MAGTRKQQAAFIGVALALGVVEALVFYGFEWAVNHGTTGLWADFVGSDEHRWRVVPLALVLSILFSILLRLLRQPRVVHPQTDLLGELGEAKPGPLIGVAVVLIIGLASLLAGASLGP